MMMKCITVDDESWALTGLNNYISKTSYLSLSGSFTNPYDAIEFIEVNDVDLVFLDIQMPELNGVSFAKILSARKEIVVFTTAFINHCADGFRFNAFGYLLKPFTYDEFRNLTDKIRLAFFTTRPDQEFFFLKEGAEYVKIFSRDILYCQAMDNYVKIIVKEVNRPIIIHCSMHALEGRLSEKHFIRVHKSYIIGLVHVERIYSSEVKIGNTSIPIGDSYKKGLKRIFNQ